MYKLDGRWRSQVTLLSQKNQEKNLSSNTEKFEYMGAYKDTDI